MLRAAGSRSNTTWTSSFNVVHIVEPAGSKPIGGEMHSPPPGIFHLLLARTAECRLLAGQLSFLRAGRFVNTGLDPMSAQILVKFVIDAIDESEPACFDDVVRYTHCPQAV